MLRQHTVELLAEPGYRTPGEGSGLFPALRCARPGGRLHRIQTASALDTISAEEGAGVPCRRCWQRRAWDQRLTSSKSKAKVRKCQQFREAWCTQRLKLDGISAARRWQFN